jgi:predicted RNase H-like HicB family nuclease
MVGYGALRLTHPTAPKIALKPSQKSRSKCYLPAMLLIETEREDDGRWLAEVPALPGVLSYGASDTEARSKATALALRVIAERVENGEALPRELSGMFPARASRWPAAKANRVLYHARKTLRSFPRKRESSSLALGPRFRGDERLRCQSVSLDYFHI